MILAKNVLPIITFKPIKGRSEVIIFREQFVTPKGIYILAEVVYSMVPENQIAT